MNIGMVTDMHFAEKQPAKTRYYRETLQKLDEAVVQFNKDKPSFVVELGDFIDRAESVDQELEWLEKMKTQFQRIEAPKYYVLGNHCVDTLTKKEFQQHSGMPHPSQHTFEVNGAQFIILDACFKQDGTAYGRHNFHWQDSWMPDHELRWLESVLAGKKEQPVVVFAHQRLDQNEHHSVKNAAQVRAVLEKSGRVCAVFQGHSHKNEYQHLNGIHYTTLAAMIEGSGAANNSYSRLDIFPDGSLKLQGFRTQKSHDLARNA